MTETNFPSPQVEPRVKKNYKNLIIGLLAAGLVAVSAYALVSNNKSQEAEVQQLARIDAVTADKMNLQSSFDASLARLDSMETLNTSLESQLTEKNSEIARVKSEIRSILNKKNASTAELGRAKSLIASLNDKISSLEMDIAQLRQENLLLANDNVTLKQEKENLNQNLVAVNEVKQKLEKTVEIGSTLNASNIVITPIDIRKSGKEKVSSKARRVDKLLVSFDVDNRIIQPGTTDVYVVVLGPDGKAINTSTETFTTRDAESIPFTAKLPVELETATRKNVEFAISPGSSFLQGNYTIQIYQNGFLIGQGVRELKKGGLFG